MQAEIQQMQEENDRLNAQIKALKSDPKAIEREAEKSRRELDEIPEPPVDEEEPS